MLHGEVAVKESRCGLQFQATCSIEWSHLELIQRHSVKLLGIVLEWKKLITRCILVQSEVYRQPCLYFTPGWLPYVYTHRPTKALLPRVILINQVNLLCKVELVYAIIYNQ
jgi:hypothetical protein